jgi:hypothetical protein
MNRFYRVGGGNRTAGFLLAVATVILLIIGPWPIAYIRKFTLPGLPCSMLSEFCCSCDGCWCPDLCVGHRSRKGSPVGQ